MKGRDYLNTAMVSGDRCVHRDLPLNFLMERHVESYVAEIKALVDCVQHDTLPWVSGRDGRIPVVMAYAAKRSMAEGRQARLSEVGTNG
jgi:myo-inositol 2-dehydrogenase/D-chiro-inositol 1-dehydrogenase